MNLIVSKSFTNLNAFLPLIKLKLANRIIKMKITTEQRSNDHFLCMAIKSSDRKSLGFYLFSQLKKNWLHWPRDVFFLAKKRINRYQSH